MLDGQHPSTPSCAANDGHKTFNSQLSNPELIELKPYTEENLYLLVTARLQGAHGQLELTMVSDSSCEISARISTLVQEKWSVCKQNFRERAAYQVDWQESSSVKFQRDGCLNPKIDSRETAAMHYHSVL